MNKKDIVSAFVAGCFSMTLSPSKTPVPESFDAVDYEPKSVWEGVNDCFNDAGLFMHDAVEELNNA